MFRSNNFDAFMDPQELVKDDAPDLTEQGMTKSVRETLEQFARTGSQIDPNKSHFSYADEFDDKEPINSDRINNLLDQPDFTGESEMEMMDFIRDNTTEIDLRSLQSQKAVESKSQEQKTENQQVEDSSIPPNPEDQQ